MRDRAAGPLSPAPSEVELNWEAGIGFFASAATAMRRDLVDAARAKQTQKRGGGRQREPLQDMPTSG